MLIGSVFLAAGSTVSLADSKTTAKVVASKGKLEILDNPIVFDRLRIIRDKRTKPFVFRESMDEIARQLIYEAVKNLPMKTVAVRTPVGKAECKCIDRTKGVFFVTILRAALGMSHVAEKIAPHAEIHHLGMYRDEDTLKPHWYYNTLPDFKKRKDVSDIRVYILDPMLATGGSICESIKQYVDKGIKEENITVLCVISAPEGIEKIFKTFPKARIVTAAVDEKLNDKGYIVPGLGDAGDRYFNFAPSK
jgi:uracil phosphoribosyltransferase